uniref:Uncharacterized protein n=1 Tax=Romanomermis culicivorax TaxID=13658 RepID=A0A915KJX8_ROMCU
MIIFQHVSANKNIRDNSGRKADHYLCNAYGTKAWPTYNIPSTENFKNSNDDGGLKKRKWRLRARFGFKSHIKSCHSFPTALNSGASCARDNRIGSLRKISFNNYTDGDAVRLRENRLSRHSVVSDKHKSAKM